MASCLVDLMCPLVALPPRYAGHHDVRPGLASGTSEMKQKVKDEEKETWKIVWLATLENWKKRTIKNNLNGNKVILLFNSYCPVEVKFVN